MAHRPRNRRPPPESLEAKLIHWLPWPSVEGRCGVNLGRSLRPKTTYLSRITCPRCKRLLQEWQRQIRLEEPGIHARTSLRVTGR